MSVAPPRVTTPRELLLDDLARLLTVETTLERSVLPKLVREAQDEELRSALAEHLGQTREHVGRVKEAFARLGATPAGKDAPGLDGLAQEQAEGARAVGPPALSVFEAGAAIGTEHYEIAVYSGAVSIAGALGEREVADLLGSNLEQEFAALKRLESIVERLARDGADGA